ncbi:MAG: hypothetical protein ACTSQQ_15565, partial [Candidatus Helarchaeota archaeon]
QGHIVASSEQNRILLAYVTPDGGAGIAYMDVARALSTIIGTGAPAAAAPAMAPTPAPQPQAQPQVDYQPATSYIQDQYSKQQFTEESRPVPKSTWASASPDTEMKNIIWEVEEFRKYVEGGNFAAFLRSLITEGDQVKIWEVLKLIRHFKSLSNIE